MKKSESLFWSFFIDPWIWGGVVAIVLWSWMMYGFIQHIIRNPSELVGILITLAVIWLFIGMLVFTSDGTDSLGKYGGEWGCSWKRSLGERFICAVGWPYFLLRWMFR
jgi:hypothetical protein